MASDPYRSPAPGPSPDEARILDALIAFLDDTRRTADILAESRLRIASGRDSGRTWDLWVAAQHSSWAAERALRGIVDEISVHRDEALDVVRLYVRRGGTSARDAVPVGHLVSAADPHALVCDRLAALIRLVQPVTEK